MTAYVEGWLYIPLQELGGNASLLKRELTIRPKSMAKRETPKPIPMYDDTVEGYLGIPIDWGLRKYPELEVEDRTTRGRRIRKYALPDPNHPLAAPNQGQFMESMLQATKDYFAFLSQAGTGTGKTVTALWVAAMRARTTLVIVPSEYLLNQWVDQIHDKLGVPYEHIGIVKQDKCQIMRPFVVGLVHSIVGRDYGSKFRNNFGTVIWDEVHRMGASTFRKSIGLFPAEAKIAMTATTKRKDGADKTYLWYFGDSQVKANTETLPCTVKVLKHKASKPLWGDTRESIIKSLTFDKERNGKILKLVSNMYDAGRYILLIGDHVKHLQDLAEGLKAMGIPEAHIGQFTASYYPRSDKGKGWATKSKKTKVTELERIQKDEEVCVVLATYGSFKEGVDIPRLDTGIDVTPRTEGVQVIGRIRRRYGEDKPVPVWYTIVDLISQQLRGYAKARIKDYKSSDNVEVVE